MDEQHYVHLADRAFARILAGFDEIDVDTAEAEHTGDVVTIVLASGQRIVANTQKPARQVWLAGGSKAWHFSYDESTGQWMDDKGRGELFDTLSKLTQELGGIDVSFEQGSKET